MPKFFFSFLTLLVLSLIVLTRTVFYSSPESILNLIIFSTSLLAALFSFLSLFTYLLLTARTTDPTLAKVRFRRLLKFPFSVSIFVTGLAILKIIGAFNLINFGLLTVLMAAYLLYFSR